MRLDALHLAATERRVEVELALGRHAELVRDEPLLEGLRAQLVLALYRAGRFDLEIVEAVWR